MEVEGGGRLNGRGDRRKRIVERGSDRLALITGRIHSLDYDDHHPNPLFPDHHHHQNHDDRRNNNNNSLTHHSHTKSSSPVFGFTHDQVDDGQQHASDGGNAFDVGGNNIGELCKCDINTLAAIQAGAAAAEMDSGHKVQQVSHHPTSTAPLPKPSNYNTAMEPPSKFSGPGFLTFNAKDISCCILATQSTRVFCSIVIALFVILYYVKLPLNVEKPKNTIASTPVFIILLTDISLVIGLLILEKHKGADKAKQERSKEEEIKGTQEHEHNWGGAVTVLELGLVLHQALRAFFIDCSFYVVIIICGFSFI